MALAAEPYPACDCGAAATGATSLIDDGAHTGEVESAQKRSDGQLAGLAQVHQELHHGGADLAELARKFVGAGLFGGIGFAAEEFRPRVGQGMEEAFEIGGQARRLLFAVHAAGAHIAHGDGDAQHLGGFLVGQVADELGEERQPVHLGEEHIDRQIDAEGLGHLAQAGTQIARGGGGALLGARPA